MSNNKKIINAVLLGLLTFIVTPVVASIVAIIFLSISKIYANFIPVVIVSKIFGLEGLGGFFLSQFIIIGSMALLGSFVTALISGVLFNSRKLAFLTFLSAVAFQIIVSVIILPYVVKMSNANMQKGIEMQKAFKGYATIDKITSEVSSPWAENQMDNDHPEWGPINNKLAMIISVNVNKPGIYAVNLKYDLVKDGKHISGTPRKEYIGAMSAGNNTAIIEFSGNEAKGKYGYWSPEKAGGEAEATLDYMASEKELLDKLAGQGFAGEDAYMQFLRDEGLDKRSPNDKPTVNKFIERKIFTF